MKTPIGHGPQTRHRVTDYEQDVVDNIIKAASSVMGVDPDDICSTSRNQRIAEARHIVCYLAIKRKIACVAVGFILRRNHATVCYGRDRIEQQVEIYPHMARLVAAVEKKVPK